MATLHFDIRDMFRVVRLGWSGKKIWVGMCGALVAWAGYSILATCSHLSAGLTLGNVWHTYGLFPGALLTPGAVLPTLLSLAAMLYAFAVILLTTSMMCKITYQQLRGDEFYSSGDALKFAKANWSGVLFGPVAVLALLAFFIVSGILIGVIGHYLPWVGELLFAVSFVPIFFAALIAVFIAIAFIVALTMSPAIVGTVGEDTLEVVIQSFSIVWGQPWRFVLYTAWMKISVLIGGVLLSGFMAATYCLLGWACGMFMGQKLANLYSVALRYDTLGISDLFPQMLETLPAASADIPGVQVWAGRILFVMLLAVTAILLSYVQAAYASGLSLTYVILRQRKDDENLLEWEDDTLTEPSFDEPASEDEGASGEGGESDSGTTDPPASSASDDASEEKTE